MDNFLSENCQFGQQPRRQASFLRGKKIRRLKFYGLIRANGGIDYKLNKQKVEPFDKLRASPPSSSYAEALEGLRKDTKLILQ
ncbi:hypothetical protein COV54_00550 [Candidatus Jorgensenbacteria bacterium CG11_big_fil_rev_8_21_14_0_20_38_23]|uniref:Uncharacterized protein n=1 Tax=Candidatus Jorgensenbacteria bacterium CG11_big_fil_rev_8_21_14_0_20_38_23 TaxID=1974594 RepID=A0A2H0NF70_9BACT|nr:MAG: hypothetical protein COV54_00550 [Candidatus Jorgensenbacteria bacterium CG11_big_fil_rev_8_21_14_0_20_38_23]